MCSQGIEYREPLGLGWCSGAIAGAGIRCSGSSFRRSGNCFSCGGSSLSGFELGLHRTVLPRSHVGHAGLAHQRSLKQSQAR